MLLAVAVLMTTPGFTNAPRVDCRQCGAHACASWQVGSFGGIVDEVQALKRDKNVLMLELVRLRQQQQARLCHVTCTSRALLCWQPGS
jgi:hypothetical protein